ncbi:UNVERIFIED_CONTAM: hypothetical protein NCL1_07447 [Trichonephila clavipes]
MAGVRHERRQAGHPAPQQGPRERTGGDQPVLPACPHVRRLGPGEARQARVQGIHRRDEACRQADQAHPLPRGPAQPAGPRQADDRRRHGGNAEVRPGAGEQRGARPARGHRPRRGHRRLRHPRAVQGNPRCRGRAHRLAGDPAHADRSGRPAELPAEPDGRLIRHCRWNNQGRAGPFPARPCRFRPARSFRGCSAASKRFLLAAPVLDGGFVGPALERAVEGAGLGETGQVDDLLDALVGARQQAPRQARAVVREHMVETGAGLLQLGAQAPRRHADALRHSLQRGVAGLQHFPDGALDLAHQIQPRQLGQLLVGHFLVQAQQAGFGVPDLVGEHGLVEIDAVLAAAQRHRAAVDTPVLLRRRAFDMGEMHFDGLEVAIGQRAEETDDPDHQRLGEVAHLGGIGEVGEIALLAVDHQARGDGIAEQTLVGQRALQTFAEGGARRNQVLQHLATIDRQVLAQVQADVRIAGNLLQRTPEHGLPGERRALRRLDIEPGRRHARLLQDGIDRQAGLEHGLISEPEQNGRVGALGHDGWMSLDCRENSGGCELALFTVKPGKRATRAAGPPLRCRPDAPRRRPGSRRDAPPSAPPPSPAVPPRPAPARPGVPVPARPRRPAR